MSNSPTAIETSLFSSSTMICAQKSLFLNFNFLISISMKYSTKSLEEVCGLHGGMLSVSKIDSECKQY